MSELRRLAEAATSGTWKWFEGTPFITRRWNGKDCAIAAVDYKGLAWHEDSNCAGRESGANAAYIAAANPVAIIGLLDEIERLKTEAVAADIRIANDATMIESLTAERDDLRSLNWKQGDALIQAKAQRDIIKSNHERLVKMVDDGSIHGRLYSAGLESERQIVALEKERDALLMAGKCALKAFEFIKGCNGVAILDPIGLDENLALLRAAMKGEQP